MSDLRRPAALLLAAAVAFGASTGCERAAPAAEAAPPPAAVTVSEPIVREVIEWDTFTGRLEATESVDVRPRVGGYVTEAPFADGSIVAAGDPLFAIDARPFQAEVDRAEAQVLQAQAQVDLNRVEFEQAQQLRPSNAISDIEFQTRQFDLRNAEAALLAARAAAETARLDLSFTRVDAPIAGRVGRKLVTPGNLVTGGPGGQATTLTTIASLDPIYCYVDVDEATVLKYQRLAREKRRDSARDGRIPAFLGLGDEPGFAREGAVDFVDNRVDPQTGTIRARAVFDNADGQLVPGFFARLRVPGSGRYEAVLVAERAVGSDQGQRFVLVVDPATNEVENRSVTLGPLFGGLRVIAEGLSAGERVVTNGLLAARPGSVVAATLAPMPDDEGLNGAAGLETAQGSPTTQALPTAEELEAAEARERGE